MVGNFKTGMRNSHKDLEAKKKEKRESKFKLKEQPNFKGSKELLSRMRDAERLYREGKPIMSDEEWDSLVKKTGYEESFDETVSPNNRLWYKFNAPLVSLNKCTSLDDLLKYISKFEKGQEFSVNLKYDGLSFDLVYEKKEDGDFYQKFITTRGDGLNGLVIGELALKGVEIEGIPDKISKETADFLREKGCVINDTIEIRGEAVIDKNDYVTKERSFDNIPARSIAAGILNRKVPNNLKYIASLFPDNLNWEDMTLQQKKILYSYGIVSKGKITEKSSPYDKCNIVNGEFITHIREESLADKMGNSWIKFDSNPDYQGKTRFKETMSFISFAIASEYGNIADTNILSSIPGVLCIGKVAGIPEEIITSDPKEIMQLVDWFYGTEDGKRNMKKVRNKNKIRFSADGIVLKPIGSNKFTQKLDPREKGGKIVVPRYPADQIAIKLPTDKSPTKIIKLNYVTTKLNNTTVTADIKPTLVEGGAIVSRVNLHNPMWLNLPENKWIMEAYEEGRVVYLQMSLDIIPILSQYPD